MILLILNPHFETKLSLSQTRCIFDVTHQFKSGYSYCYF